MIIPVEHPAALKVDVSAGAACDIEQVRVGAQKCPTDLHAACFNVSARGGFDVIIFIEPCS